MRLPFAFAFIGSLLLLLASKSQAGSERVTGQPVIEVDVVLKTENTWTHRKAKVHPFGDGRIVVCEETKSSVLVMCIVLVDDGDAVLAQTRLLEEKV
jgi:hypothetical protein